MPQWAVIGRPVPYGADFVRGVVTDGEGEIELRSVGPGKLVQALAAQTRRRHMRRLQRSQHLGAELSPSGGCLG
ncbi:MAG TPA: hypothetical protein VIX37_16265 [Candidatus Sulfotelmatobacter sp.]